LEGLEFCLGWWLSRLGWWREHAFGKVSESLSTFLSVLLGGGDVVPAGWLGESQGALEEG
jgi:hypothetical protein